MTLPRIRTAAPADLAALIALEEVCEGPDAWSRALIAAGVEGSVPTTTWLVATAEQPQVAEQTVIAERTQVAEVTGYAVLSAVDDVAELQRIGVLPAARRAGIASALVADVVVRARAAGAARLLLEVREGNAPALALYARAGFAEIARRARYYADGTTAVVMELPLAAAEWDA